MTYEASVLWHSAKWLPFIKWPSSHEVDFGKFVVSYNFKEGVAQSVFPDGRCERLFNFQACDGSRGVLGVTGEVTAGAYALDLKRAENLEISVRGLEGASERVSIERFTEGREIQLRLGDVLTYEPRTEKGRVSLHFECNAQLEALAITLASLLVFERYIIEKPTLGAEEV
jgi:hypothetical protein